MKSNIYQIIKKRYSEYVIDFSKIYNATIINIENTIHFPKPPKIGVDRNIILEYLHKLIDREKYKEINKTLLIHSNALKKNDFFSLYKYSENKAKIIEKQIKENKNLFWFLLLNFIVLIFLSFLIWLLFCVFMFFNVSKTVDVIGVVTMYIIMFFLIFIEIRRIYPPVFVQKSQLYTMHKIIHLFDELNIQMV